MKKYFRAERLYSFSIFRTVKIFSIAASLLVAPHVTAGEWLINGCSTMQAVKDFFGADTRIKVVDPSCDVPFEHVPLLYFWWGDGSPCSLPKVWSNDVDPPACITPAPPEEGCNDPTPYWDGLQCAGPQDCDPGEVRNASGLCEEIPPGCGESPNQGNPVHVPSGSKNQRFVDLTLGDISIARFYNQDKGKGFWHFDHRESLADIKVNGVEFYRYSHNGITEFLQLKGDSCWRSLGTSCYRIEANTSGWKLTSNKGVKIFESSGRLLQEYSYGLQSPITYSYTDTEVTLTSGLEDKVTLENRGKTLQITFDTLGRTKGLAWGEHTILYEYTPEGMLSKVVYPNGDYDFYNYDATKPTYLIEAGSNGEIYAQWEYHSDGRVSLSKHAGNVDKFLFSYDESANTTTVTNPLGKNTTYHFNNASGVRRLVNVEGEPTASCLGANQGYTYYPENSGAKSGLMKTKTDWAGNITFYNYNDRGQKMLTIEGYVEGQTQDPKSSITTMTEWHTYLNRPISVSVNGKTTRFSYSRDGKLLQQQILAAPTP